DDVPRETEQELPDRDLLRLARDIQARAQPVVEVAGGLERGKGSAEAARQGEELLLALAAPANRDVRFELPSPIRRQLAVEHLEDSCSRLAAIHGHSPGVFSP